MGQNRVFVDVTFRGVEQKDFLAHLDRLLNYYVQDIVRRGDNGELSGQEYYQYIRYKSIDEMVVPVGATVRVDDKAFRVGLLLERFLQGDFNPTKKLVGFTSTNIEDWMKERKVRYGFDKKDQNTAELVLEIKGYVDELVRRVEFTGGTKRQRCEYNKMMLGEPLELLNDIVANEKGASKNRLINKMVSACDFVSKSYHSEVVRYILKEYNIVYRIEDKNKLRQKELMKAISIFKQDIMNRYREGTLKTKEYSTYEKIKNFEQFELPYRVVVNIGSAEFPLDFELGRTIELIGEQIMSGKRNAYVTDDMFFVNKIIDKGIKFDDEVLCKIEQEKVKYENERNVMMTKW